MKTSSALSALTAAFFAFALTPTASAAEISEKAIGSYEQKGDYWQRVKISRRKKDGQFVGAFDVATRGCQGDVTMNGVADGENKILFSKQDDAVPGGVCKIAVTFSDDFGKIDVSHEYCGYSGAACDFNGTLKRSGRK